MALTKKKWVFASEPNSNTIEQLVDALGIDPFIARLLAQRGMCESEKAKSFFKPSVADLHDPFLMKGMDKAVQRIISAIDNGEKILVYGDYDVDGTTSVAMMYTFLKRITQKTGYYIPDRYTEGYGVSAQGIEYAKDNGYTLIITLDCGIRAVNMVDYALKFGIDTIVCDHHNPGEFIPRALAILDPKQEDCPYPFKELSGCGVGFKLIHAVCLTRNLNLKENLFCFLDLLAISIASDIVPIVGENRILASFGLKKIKLSPIPGIEALVDISGLKDTPQLTITDIVFKIGPRINAAGRIETGSRAVELLISETADFAKNIALEVDSYNEDRKGIDRQITEEALEMIENDHSASSSKTTVLFQKYWHKGVVGIVASRLIEHHYKPTIVLTESEGKISGSARSVDGFDLYAALEKCDDLLTNWGGHKYAAGMSMKPEMLESFKKRFEQAVAETITDEQLIPKIYIDEVIPLKQINPKFHKQLQLFEPFGPGNMTPIFASHNVCSNGGTKPVGADKSHLKLSILDESSPSPIGGIAFGMGNLSDDLQDGLFSVSYTIAENIFRGQTSLQLMVRDITTEKH